MTPHLTVASAVLLILGAVTVRYLFLCWVFPFRSCRKCDGRGRLATPLGRLTRQCRRCRGTGIRLRIGRHVMNHYRRVSDDAHRPTRETASAGAPWQR